MIPLRDANPAKNYPLVNHGLIALNVLVYLVQLGQGAQGNLFIYRYGLVPARYSLSAYAAYFTPGEQLLSFVSFMFLHGGFWHLAGNMWILYIFGNNVEDRLGPLRYFFFYLSCGLLSGLSHLLFNLHSNAPIIGASGAIAGVMGAYFILYPHARILTLIPIIIIPWIVEIPAFIFLGLWLVLQFLNATGERATLSNIAWWAHIGGFVFGAILLKAFTALPSTGIGQPLRKMTSRRKSPRIHMVRSTRFAGEPDRHGVIELTAYEALAGVTKLVTVSVGGHRRLLKVTVPPGIKEGAKLRLRGVTSRGKGDLMLKVKIIQFAG